MNNKQILLASTAIIAASASAMAADGGEKRPNIIMILTDDQPRSLLGCYGHPIVQTPNIDKLAAEGIRFTNAHITSTTSCPSRTCLLTGRYERSHGVDFQSATSLSEEAWSECYPMVLRESGYYTGYIGKNHTPVGEKSYYSGVMEEGFDYWYGGHRHLTFYPKTKHKLFRGAKADTQVELLEEGMLDFMNPNERSLEGAKHFINNRPEGQPFFLNICFNLPHGAGVSTMKMLDTDPALYRTMYRDKDLKLPLPDNYVAWDDIEEPRLPADVLKVEQRQRIYEYTHTPEELFDWNIKEMESVTGIDLLVGAVMAELTRQDIADNTIIIFSTDHGIFNGQYGLYGKGFCYEYVSNIPMIIYDPRAKGDARSGVNDELVAQLDLSATILDYAGATIPEAYQGKSLIPMINGDLDQLRQYHFTESLWSNCYGNPYSESVQDKEWKYIRYYKNNNVAEGTTGAISTCYDYYRGLIDGRLKEGVEPVYEELFHLKNDPWEAENVIEKRGNRKILEKLRAECDAQLKIARGEGEPRVVRHDDKVAK